MAEVILTVFATLAAVAVTGWMVVVWRAWKQQNASRARLEQAVGGMTAAIKELSGHGDAQVKMLAGLIEVSKVQVAHLDRFTTSVEQFKKVIIKDTGGDSFVEYDEKAANREYEIQEYMRNGKMPREEAEARVDQIDVWRKMTVQG